MPVAPPRTLNDVPGANVYSALVSTAEAPPTAAVLGEASFWGSQEVLGLMVLCAALGIAIARRAFNKRSYMPRA